MSVALLPFEKVVDMPDVAERHNVVLRRLSISSFVLSFLILPLFVTALLATAGTYVYSDGILVCYIIWIAVLMAALSVLGCTSSVAALHNTDKWVSTDICCNLMRSHPACCTRSCGRNKHCCARLSCAHIAAAVLASILCVFAVVLLISGCRDVNSYYAHTANYCPIMVACLAPIILVLAGLAATTAVSARLLRRVEHALPDLALLPPGKMVEQTFAHDTTQAVTTQAVAVCTVIVNANAEKEQSNI